MKRYLLIITGLLLGVLPAACGSKGGTGKASRELGCGDRCRVRRKRVLMLRRSLRYDFASKEAILAEIR